jgi:transcriptional regulator with XRE-family HTH domain
VAKTQRKIIGEAVLRFRKKVGLSQEALAEKADIHPNYVGRIERGECSASVEILLKIAKALDIRPHKLFLKL